MKSHRWLPARKYRLWFLLLCATGLYFFANLQRVAIPGTVFDLLQERLHAGAPYITALGASFMYVYAVAQLLVGLFLDRYGGIRTILVGGLLFCLGSLMFPLCRYLPLLYLARALTGLGASSIFLSMVMEICRAFPRNYSLMISIFLMIGYTGGIAAAAPFNSCIGLMGFTQTLILTAVISGIFYAGFFSSGQTLKLPPIRQTPIGLSNFGKVFKLHHNIMLFTFNALAFAVYYILQTVIGKKFLEDFCLIAPKRAAVMLSVLATLAAVSSFFFAILCKTLGNRRKLVCVMTGVIDCAVFGGVILMLVFDYHSPLAFWLFCPLALFSSLGPITIPVINETNSSDITGSATAAMNCLAYIVLAILGNVAGFLLHVFPVGMKHGVEFYSRESYLVLFGFLGLLSAILLIAALRLKETRGKFTEVS